MVQLITSNYMKRLFLIISLLLMAGSQGSMYAQAFAVSERPFTFDFSETKPVNVVPPDRRQEVRPPLIQPTVAKSDVDINIPVTTGKRDRTFAVIIANENYKNESPVLFAGNDGVILKQYCLQTLGMGCKKYSYL